MTMLARFEGANDLGDRRATDRRLLKLQVAGALVEGPGVDVFIHDLSRSGLLIETWANLAVGTQIEVDLPDAGKTVAKIVWSTGRYFGCQFNSPIPASALSAAMLKNPVSPTRPMRDAAPASTDVRGTEEVGVLSLGARLRIIIALASLIWVAIFVMAAVS